MDYVSTRAGGPAVSLSQAIATGLAPDGGLYVPDTLPQHDPDDFDPEAPLERLAADLLAPFFDGDPLADDLERLCKGAFTFPIPLTAPRGDKPLFRVLELFHGPTAAFKDMGARFLAQALSAMEQPTDDPFTVLVATSGDTGGAVAAAFDDLDGAQVVILFPDGRVSSLQQHQLTCWSETVLSLSVRPDFDACQALAKRAFADPDLTETFRLTSANSINIARLLAQMVYYVQASLQVEAETGQSANFIVPTGNLGNALAGLWVKAMGFPVGRILFATNANKTLSEYTLSGSYTPRASVATLASAMDVGAPSNFERLSDLYDHKTMVEQGIAARSVPDEAISGQITRDYRGHGIIWCPHTAAAAAVYDDLDPHQWARPWVVLATAHASKFPETVEPLIGEAVPPVPALAALLDRPSRFERIDDDVEALGRAMRQRFRPVQRPVR